MSDQLVESPKEETPELPSSNAEASSPADTEETAADTSKSAVPSSASSESQEPVAEAATPTAEAEASEPREAAEETGAEKPEVTEATVAEAAVEAAAEASSESTIPPVEAAPESQAEAANTEPEAEKVEPKAKKTEPKATNAEPEAASKKAASSETASADPSAEEDSSKAVDGTKPAEANSAEMIALQKALKDKALIEGQVIGWNKGGYHVALGKIAAFCPVSQIEIGNPRAPKRYLDKTFKFRVIEIQDGGRRVVVSRSAALEAERTARAEEVRNRLVKGAVLEGRVSSLTDFGAFVNLGGGIEGLVHISEISRRRVEHPKDALKHRQKVKVSVLKVENDGDRISLSMKALEADPWKGVAERHESGAEFEGTILRRTDFGLFVEVEPGLEGLVHVSRLPIGVDTEDESLAVGQKVKGWVHEVDAKRRRLSLSLREVASNDPWKGIEERFREGEVITGTVERIANFGAFVALEPGLTGLLSFSAVNTAPHANLRKQFHPGREIKVRILSIDKGRRRISLGTELSKAEGSQQDYREYLKQQRKQGGGLNSLAAAFAKLKED